MPLHTTNYVRHTTCYVLCGDLCTKNCFHHVLFRLRRIDGIAWSNGFILPLFNLFLKSSRVSVLSGSGEWTSVTSYGRRSSAGDSLSKSCSAAKTSTPIVVRTQPNMNLNSNNNNYHHHNINASNYRNNQQPVNQFSIFTKKPNARCFYPLGKVSFRSFIAVHSIPLEWRELLIVDTFPHPFIVKSCSCLDTLEFHE